MHLHPPNKNVWILNSINLPPMGDTDQRYQQQIVFPQIDDAVIPGAFAVFAPVFAFEGFVSGEVTFLKFQDFRGDEFLGVWVELEKLFFRTFLEGDFIHRFRLF